MHPTPGFRTTAVFKIRAITVSHCHATTLKDVCFGVDCPDAAQTHDRSSRRSSLPALENTQIVLEFNQGSTP